MEEPRSTKRIHRRAFLARTAAGLAAGLPALRLGQTGPCWATGPNDEIRLAVIGLGGLNIPGSVGGRGRQLISRFSEVPGVRIAALCDIDRAILDHEAEEFKKRGQSPAAYSDLRRVFDDPHIDAVAVATPNHWHALATIWACQAGKDVYVEKPFAYNLWEGKQAVAAARKYGRIVQTGSQSRSSAALPPALEFLRSGQLGPLRYVHAVLYRQRGPMERVSAPSLPPPTLDYDMWCGPAPKGEIRRKNLHYDWHWFWATGNGEIGNNGAHVVDVCRWFLGQNDPPPRTMSLGGRFAFHDGGETPNTHIAIWDYQPVPILCEVRNLKPAKGDDPQGKYRGIGRGLVVDCEGGYFMGDSPGGTAYDSKGRTIKEFNVGQKPAEIETAHAANFIAAVRSRKREDLHSEARVGHVSAACLHLANVSYRLGKEASAEAIAESIQSDRQAGDAFARCREHLRSVGVDLTKTPAVYGPWVNFDGKNERFVGQFADQASALSERTCRKPYIVPKIV
jgi:predicted dehydrogenase